MSEHICVFAEMAEQVAIRRTFEPGSLDIHTFIDNNIGLATKIVITRVEVKADKPNKEIDLSVDELELIKQGEIIKAIRSVREHTGADLRNAKEAVDLHR